MSDVAIDPRLSQLKEEASAPCSPPLKVRRLTTFVGPRAQPRVPFKQRAPGPLFPEAGATGDISQEEVDGALTAMDLDEERSWPKKVLDLSDDA